MLGKEMGKWLAEGTTALWCYHSTFSLVLLTAALWKDIRFTSERHLRYVVGGQK